jgi:hypothetical protein
VGVAEGVGLGVGLGVAVGEGVGVGVGVGRVLALTCMVANGLSDNRIRNAIIRICSFFIFFHSYVLIAFLVKNIK